MSNRAQHEVNRPSNPQRDVPGSAARPTLVVGSAERALDDLRSAAADDAAALLQAEMDRCRDAARTALQSLKDTLAALEHTCDETMRSQHDAGRAGVAGFADKLVSVAATASEASAERARAEVRAELEKIQAALDAARAELQQAHEQLQSTVAGLQAEQATRAQLEAELQRERDLITALGEKLQAEQAARAEAEAAAKDAERALRAELDGYRAQAERAQQQLDAEKAERARLVSAIQRVVDPGEGAAQAAALKASLPVSESTRSTGPAPAAPSADAARTLKALEQFEHEPEPELVAYVQHLFHTLESMYAADVAAGRKPDDLLNRLTQNLRSARNVFRNHIGAADGADLTLFDRQLSELLNSPDEKAFARHLGIAAYECAKAERAQGRAAPKEAK